MTKLAHAAIGAPGMQPEKKALASLAQHEISEAKRIQKQTGCSWSEAIKKAYQHPFLSGENDG